MVRNELVDSLNEWKNGVDPENRSRNFSIIEFRTQNETFEHVVFFFNREPHSFNFTVNQNGEVIIENFDDPTFSGFISLSTFRKYVFGL